ncbi:hypothetical protein CTAYLR_001078 [Chrysophaeum taylorii]|uniref:subtilisin n=1 Tax=Chrysophaeum taylorii TaxID=2483200 RepID=A0AAD7XJP0_9STRA|nr:hypothetical protein CTAYLR_001078 [Chrysophaeum taylorii]
MLSKLLIVAGGVLAFRTQMEEDVKKFSSANWKVGARVEESEELAIEFWLKHDKEDIRDFEKELLELSTPGSARYGKWLSPEEVVEKLSPSREAIDAVLDFVVNDLGASDVHVIKHKSVVKVKVPAGAVERALETRLFHHTHVKYTKVDIVRVVEPYSLPTRVARHVSVVGELVRFPRMRFADVTPVVNLTAPENAASEWSACGTRYSAYVNPSVLAERYGFTFPKRTYASGNSIAVAEFQDEYYDDTDLEDFSELCGLSETITVSTTVGGNSATRCSVGLEPCIESLLDIEYAGAIAGAIPLQVYYSSSYSLLDLASTLSDADDPPLVISVSYGDDEAEQTGSAFMEAVNTAFMKNGASGISIIFAAGDQGVWGREGLGTEYHPDFPAGSPYVTAVGGTDFVTKSTIGDETAWEDGGSGFSDEFDTASWQTDEVSAYLKTDDLPSSSFYNADGRGYPDLSALAGEVNPYLISYKDGTYGGVSGTSAASPVVAAIIAQINDARLSAGKSSLGFLNPMLYAAGESGGCFNDVTSGTTDGGYSGGFTAEEGWDAATGYGTIIYSKLEEFALSY